MYLCKLIKKDVSNGKEYCFFERIAKKPEILRREGKKFARKHYKKDDRVMTSFVDLKGFKRDLKASGDAEHLFSHDTSTVFTEYGEPIWILSLQVTKVEELKGK